jgi:hypothetical protein
MKTFALLLFENKAFIINNGLLKEKTWTGQLAGLLRNQNFHIEFHSKLFIGIKNGLKNEMIQLNHFLKNLNQMIVMNFGKVRIGFYFLKSF